MTQDSRPLTLGAAQQRAVVVLLALEAGRAVSRAALVDGIWGDDPPDSAANTLQVYVSQLRKLLGREVIRTVGAGYALNPAAVTLDRDRFARLAAEGSRQLERGEAKAASETLQEALVLWRGPALADVAEFPFAQPEIARLEELRLAAIEQRIEADLACGRHRELVAELRALVASHPFRERPYAQLMLALYRSGRQADALQVYRDYRSRLDEELGLEPSATLRRLESDVLRRDPALDRVPEPRPLGIRPGAADYSRTLPLIGRDRELQQLLGAWRGAQAGAGAVVTISGEPGIGKTRLAAELLECARADGARTASCAALDLGGEAPLTLWAELIGDLTADLKAPPPDAAWPAALSPLVPDLKRRLGRDPGPRVGASPDLERARLFEATVALLEWVGRRPLVLLLEDVHAADTASLELAGYVGRRVARLPALIVLTRRPLPHRPHVDALEHALRTRGSLATELTLTRLPSAQIARLARQVAPLDDRDLDQVVTAADGNALVAVEWARALARGEREPPASLRGAVRAALAPLHPHARRLADFAAVAGRELALPEVEALDIGAPADAAAGALDSGLFVAAGGRVGFRHALLREAAYHDLPEPRRAALHSAFASALAKRGGEEAPRFAAEAARHFRLAGQGDLAVAQLIRAAAHARSVAALTEAAEFLAEAVNLAPAQAEPLVELAEVEAWRGRDEASEAAFARAVEALRSAAGPKELARAWARRANWNRGALCHPRRVGDSARTAIQILDSAAALAADVRVEALAAWAWAEAVAGEADAADALLARAHEVLGADSDGDLVTYWLAHARAFSLVRRGRFQESYDPQIAAGEAAQRAGRPDLAHGCWCNAACAAACAGDPTRALEFVDRGMAALRGTGLATLEVQLLAARAHVLVRMARLDEARSASEAERALAERLDNGALQATSEHDRGLVALALRDFAYAERLIAAALVHDAPVSRPLARLARAEALIGLGRYDDAEQELRATALEPVRPSDMPDTLVPRLTRLQGLIAAGRGDSALAERRLTEAAEGWHRLIGSVAAGDRYTVALADLGRPPVVGLVEPARELDRVRAELATLHRTSA